MGECGAAPALEQRSARPQTRNWRRHGAGILGFGARCMRGIRVSSSLHSNPPAVYVPNLPMKLPRTRARSSTSREPHPLEKPDPVKRFLVGLAGGLEEISDLIF